MLSIITFPFSYIISLHLLILSLMHIRLSDCVDLLEDMEQRGLLDMNKVGLVIWIYFFFF